MPELPEVETIVQGLNGSVLGRTIRAVRLLHPKPARPYSAAQFQALLAGQTIEAVKRRGKYIDINLGGGAHLVVHLRMTGKFIFCAVRPAALTPHVRLIIGFTDRSCLLFDDTRIFGTLRYYPAGQAVGEFSRLGPDPLTERVSAAYLLEQAGRRKVPLKNLLLDQTVLCGLGNIYAAESLFRARLNPLLPARGLSNTQARQLLTAIRAILTLAVKHNGTSIQDYRTVDNKSGRFQQLLQVYGRAGKKCLRCRTGTVTRIKQAQRSTFYCPVCQPLPGD